MPARDRPHQASGAEEPSGSSGLLLPHHCPLTPLSGFLWPKAGVCVETTGFTEAHGATEWWHLALHPQIKTDRARASPRLGKFSATPKQAAAPTCKDFSVTSRVARGKDGVQSVVTLSPYGQPPGCCLSPGGLAAWETRPPFSIALEGLTVARCLARGTHTWFWLYCSPRVKAMQRAPQGRPKLELRLRDSCIWWKDLEL